MPFKVNVTLSKEALGGSPEQKWEIKASGFACSLLQLLQENEIPIRSNCMGKGQCRQCRVKVISGIAARSIKDELIFSKEELLQGWRLACELRPKVNLSIELPFIYNLKENFEFYRAPVSDWKILVDIGTTGIEVAALDKEGLWSKVTGLNRQIPMGADVITRLDWAIKNGIEKLNQKILDQIFQWTDKINLFQKNNLFLFNKQFFFVGNSAMISFLMNLKIDSLAVYPYQPEQSGNFIHKIEKNYEFFALPLLHGFIGSDLYAEAFWIFQNKGLKTSWMILDVGTNSEILYWDCEKLWLSSAPAGPAFEGATISIGMRAETGAISELIWNNGFWTYKVIGGDLAKGVCGSGLVSWIEQAVSHELINCDGEILSPNAVKITDQLSFLQEDVRAFQLAKSAIQTGMELLISKSLCHPETLFLSGAFGSHLSIDRCQKIGLLPLLPNGSIQPMGNLALQGLTNWVQASKQDKESFHQWIMNSLAPVELAMENDFQDKFIKNMVLREQE